MVPDTRTCFCYKILTNDIEESDDYELQYSVLTLRSPKPSPWPPLSDANSTRTTHRPVLRLRTDSFTLNPEVRPEMNSHESTNFRKNFEHIDSILDSCNSYWPDDFYPFQFAGATSNRCPPYPQTSLRFPNFGSEPGSPSSVLCSPHFPLEEPEIITMRPGPAYEIQITLPVKRFCGITDAIRSGDSDPDSNSSFDDSLDNDGDSSYYEDSGYTGDIDSGSHFGSDHVASSGSDSDGTITKATFCTNSFGLSLRDEPSHAEHWKTYIEDEEISVSGDGNTRVYPFHPLNHGMHVGTMDGYNKMQNPRWQVWDPDSLEMPDEKCFMRWESWD